MKWPTPACYFCTFQTQILQKKLMASAGFKFGFWAKMVRMMTTWPSQSPTVDRSLWTYLQSFESKVNSRYTSYVFLKHYSTMLSMYWNEVRHHYKVRGVVFHLILATILSHFLHKDNCFWPSDILSRICFQANVLQPCWINLLNFNPNLGLWPIL